MLGLLILGPASILGFSLRQLDAEDDHDYVIHLFPCYISTASRLARHQPHSTASPHNLAPLPTKYAPETNVARFEASAFPILDGLRRPTVQATLEYLTAIPF